MSAQLNSEAKLFAEFGEVMAAAAAAVQQALAVFEVIAAGRTEAERPMEIVRDESLPRHVCKVREGVEDYRLHPLDAIYLEHEGDPFAQLDAMRDYVVDRAHRELDALAFRLEQPTASEQAEQLVKFYERVNGYRAGLAQVWERARRPHPLDGVVTVAWRDPVPQFPIYEVVP